MTLSDTCVAHLAHCGGPHAGLCGKCLPRLPVSTGDDLRADSVGAGRVDGGLDGCLAHRPRVVTTATYPSAVSAVTRGCDEASLQAPVERNESAAFDTKILQLQAAPRPATTCPREQPSYAECTNRIIRSAGCCHQSGVLAQAGAMVITNEYSQVIFFIIRHKTRHACDMNHNSIRQNKQCYGYICGRLTTIGPAIPS